MFGLALGAGLASAGQTHILLGAFCEPTGVGTPPCAPSFGSSYSLAVHQPDGDLLVLEASAKRIRRFKPNGEPDPFPALGSNTIDGKMGPGSKACAEEAASCDATSQNGFTLSADFANEQQLAVDSSGGATDGNIYLTQKNASGLHLVYIFDSTGAYRGALTGTAEGLFGESSRPDGVAVAPGGEVFISDFNENKIYKYTPSGQPPTNADGTLFSAVTEKPGQLAAGAGPSAGSLFVGLRNDSTLKLNAGGGVVCEVHHGSFGNEPASTSAVVVNPADGHVLVANRAIFARKIFEYDAQACGGGAEATLVASFGSREYRGVAVDATRDRVYVTENAKVGVYSGLVPLPDATTTAASNIGETSATLNGTLETQGEEVTECSFEYVSEATYQPEAADPYAGGDTVPCAESAAEIGTGTAAVHADIASLGVETAYHYRLLAANANGAGTPGGDVRFQTVGKPKVVATWSEGVSNSEATLRAQINPQSAGTTYRIEWGTSAAHGNSGPDVAIGAQPVVHTVGLFLRDLVPGTTYHFRVVAENHCHPESDPSAVCASEGPDTVLRTFPVEPGPVVGCPNDAVRGGASAFLPDCRAYEMVSPVDKNGGDIFSELSGASDPGGRVQATLDGNGIAYTTVSASFAGAPASLRFNQYLAHRGAGGWSNRGVHPEVLGQSIDPDFTFGFEREFMAFTPDLCNGWLVDNQTPPLQSEGQVGYANLLREGNCPGGLETLTTAPPPPGTNLFYVDQNSVQGISADGSHAIFAAKAALTPDAAPGGGEQNQLYDRHGGALHLVSVLPGGAPASGSSEVGSGFTRNLAGAVSDDGSRVYWSTGQLYLREHPEQGIVAGECVGDAACSVEVSAHAATFWAGSPDGSRAVYSEEGIGGTTLREFDLGRYENGEVASRTIAPHVLGFVAASEDLDRVYFVSTDALPGAGQNSESDEAAAAQPNLYLYEAGPADGPGSFHFVGTLSRRDVGEREPGTPVVAYNLVSQNPLVRAARVSPDGRRIVFNSRAPLTGYDNTDTASGKAVVEVFAYEAGGALECVSCNPTGGRPASRELPEAYLRPWNLNSSPTEVPAAAWIPGWEQKLQVSRLVSTDGGRIFFNATDALLPRDVNGAQDVYEWEAPGTGGCDTASPHYFAQNGGCLYLISSGESPYESEVWEASGDGSDVFFTTESRLLPQDPGSIDLYDARVGGGFPQPVEPVACEGEACQSPPPPPRLSAPASSTYSGPANPGGAKPRPCRKGQRRVRRHGKVRCVKRRAGGKYRARGRHR